MKAQQDGVTVTVSIGGAEVLMVQILWMSFALPHDAFLKRNNVDGTAFHSIVKQPSCGP
ncbi:MULTISPECIES: hypothetical protein [Mesorhizobium]|uniref:Uncharacterized protein n=1 Tax=Mesorhizobium calcicola TaxID=1300310 RepID=A0ABW4WDN6_9HYPH|nr:hypothetical protein [Mesorhizobium sophorae]